MKKVLTMMLSAVLCLQLTACALPVPVNSYRSQGSSRDENDRGGSTRAEAGTRNSQSSSEDDAVRGSDTHSFFADNAAGGDGTSAAANTYQSRSAEFINAAMEASFLDKYDNYAKYSSVEAGRSLYESEMRYYAKVIMYLAQVEEEYLDEATLDGFQEVARIVLKNVRWEIVAINVDSKTGQGIVELDLYPTDFFDLIGNSSEFDTAVETYNIIYDGVLKTEGTISDEREAEMEAWFGEQILAVCQQYADQAKVVSTPVNKLYKVDYDANDGVLSDDDWDEVDDIIMDFN